MPIRRVLIVDDDPDFAEGMAELLESHGHAVEYVLNGEDAVERFRKRPFDIAFLDMRMPRKNGVELFGELKQINPNVWCVVMTGHTMPELRERALRDGIKEVLDKPIDVRHVLKLIHDAKAGNLVLVADDDPDFADELKSLLRDAGITAVIACDGREALEKLMRSSFDLLLLDLRLPTVHGIDVYRELRRMDLSIPTIVITGYADHDVEAVDEMRRSVIDIMSKPIDESRLLALVRAVATRDPDRPAVL